MGGGVLRDPVTMWFMERDFDGHVLIKRIHLIFGAVDAFDDRCEFSSIQNDVI